ncbi:hypothetical protein ACFUAC_09970 [Streptomyces sp. NPDC057148]|uniref:hypothetical protein n=1 Tax=unclassified Streptomyces TaxID=2593676 RepID=UPI003631D7AC
MSDAKEAGDRAMSHEAADDRDRDGGTGTSGLGRRLSCLAVVVAVLAVGTGSLFWFFQDQLLHPFGDARACEGSDTKLPQVISAGGVPIPAGASDVHYFTRNGSAEVAFVSGQIPDYLHRAGILPDGDPLFDEKYGTKAVADDKIELPDGLCGSPLRGPVWIYHSTSATGSSVNVMVERSPTVNDSFRFPARAVVTYNLP